MLYLAVVFVLGEIRLLCTPQVLLKYAMLVWDQVYAQAITFTPAIVDVTSHPLQLHNPVAHLLCAVLHHALDTNMSPPVT